MPRAALALLFLGAFGFFGLFAHGYVENTDAEITMHAARAWWLRGNPGLRAEGADTWPAERVIAGLVAEGKFGLKGVDGLCQVWFPIGHQLLMVPCAALGEELAARFPLPESAYEGLKGEVFGQFWWTRCLVSFLPAVAAAGAFIALVWLMLGLGSPRREALAVALVATLCTQAWPGASETLADGPGGCCLLVMAALVLPYLGGRGGARALLLAGISGGFAVCLRYQHALPVGVLALFAARAALARRRGLELAMLALGAAPLAAFVLSMNWLRFGSLLETGYSAGANPRWWSYPPWLGIPMILAAPGKGVLWFSTPLWLALPALLRRGALRAPRLPALLVFALPLVLFGHTGGWAAGQCWSVRYMTPSVVLLVAVGLALGKPWQRHPRWFACVCALGLLVSLGGVLTPYRGQQDLAYQAGGVLYPDAPQRDNNVNFAPRLSPLHTHWIYAGLAATGRIERGGSENTTRPLFGVDVAGAKLTWPGEDSGFRHWWMVFAARHFGMPLLPVAVAWLAATCLCLALAVRGLLVARPG